MPIDRGPWNALVDDDGSNLVGTIWNKDKIKTVILDPADAAYASPPTGGTWTPIDASGAGLSFAVTAGRCQYQRQARIVVVVATLSYPVTANASPAKIGGLPFAHGTNLYGGLYPTSSAISLQLMIAPTATVIDVKDGATGTARTNAQLSGIGLVFAGVYLTD